MLEFVSVSTRYYRHTSEQIRKTMMETLSKFLAIASNDLELKVLESFDLPKEILSHFQDLRNPLQKLDDLQKIQTEIPNDSLTSEYFSKLLEGLYGLARAKITIFEAELKFSDIFIIEGEDARNRYFNNILQ